MVTKRIVLKDKGIYEIVDGELFKIKAEDVLGFTVVDSKESPEGEVLILEASF